MRLEPIGKKRGLKASALDSWFFDARSAIKCDLGLKPLKWVRLGDVFCFAATDIQAQTGLGTRPVQNKWRGKDSGQPTPASRTREEWFPPRAGPSGY